MRTFPIFENIKIIALVISLRGVNGFCSWKASSKTRSLTHPGWCYDLVMAVVRASVPKMLLDDVFEQKNEIANNVKEELEKVQGSTDAFQ